VRRGSDRFVLDLDIGILEIECRKHLLIEQIAWCGRRRGMRRHWHKRRSQHDCKSGVAHVRSR